MLAAGREIEVVLVRNGAQQTLRFTPDLIEKDHAADLGVRPMMRMRLGPLEPGEPAERAGMQVGDVILAVDGVPVDAERVLAAIRGNIGKPLIIRVRAVRPSAISRSRRSRRRARAGSASRPAPRPRPCGRRASSTPSASAIATTSNRPASFSRRCAACSSARPRRSSSTGFIGIAEASGAMAAEGAAALFMFMAMLSMNLAILNLLPIPMLDGGHIFIMMLEGLARRDFSLRVKERLLMAGFVLVMTLMVTVIYNDLMRIDWIQHLVPWR